MYAVRSNYRHFKVLDSAHRLIWGAFGPRKASKVEKQSSRGVSCALFAHTRVHVSFSSATAHLWLGATPLSLPKVGTVYTDILGLIVLHVIMTRTIIRIRDLTQYMSLKDPLLWYL